MKEDYSGHEHLQNGVSAELEDTFRSTRKSAVLGYEELRGLSELRPQDCAHGIDFLE
jgi:hypothetical protein